MANKFPLGEEANYYSKVKQFVQKYEFRINEYVGDLIKVKNKKEINKIFKKIKREFEDIEKTVNYDLIVNSVIENLNNYNTKITNEYIASIAIEYLSKKELRYLGLSLETGKVLNNPTNAENPFLYPIIQKLEVDTPKLKIIKNKNIDLLKDIPIKMQKEIKKTVFKRKNKITNETEKTIELEKQIKKYGLSRAALITEDQVGKINSLIRKIQAKKSGIERFVWMTEGDDRVRPEHEALNEMIFTYEEGSPEGFPGEPVRCRCMDEPYFEDVIKIFKNKLEEK